MEQRVIIDGLNVKMDSGTPITLEYRYSAFDVDKWWENILNNS